MTYSPNESMPYLNVESKCFVNPDFGIKALKVLSLELHV